MKLNDFYNEVARKADTEGTSISAAATKRVLACMFDELEDLTAAEAAEVISKGLQQAKKRRR